MRRAGGVDTWRWRESERGASFIMTALTLSYIFRLELMELIHVELFEICRPFCERDVIWQP
jgi:hypothetical protein